MLDKEELKKEIIYNISKKYDDGGFFRKSLLKEENIIKIVDNYLNIALKDYNVFSKLENNFKSFFINIATHQCNPTVHPLTCGISSSHQLLVPRFDYSGKPYLVCPTCYSIQETMPMLY